jgi:hypothetical protein
MLVKTAKKLCDNVLALLAKKPEYIKHIVCNTLSKLEKALICRLG